LAVTLFAAVAAVTAATATGGGKAPAALSGTVSVISEATGPEQKNFQAVLAGFKALNPGVTVKYTSAGRNISTVLSTAVQGGNPPDIALLPQPGLMRDFAQRGALKPLTFARRQIANNWAASWLQLGTVDGTLYGMFFKGANKSTVWYNTAAFKNAGAKPPRNWGAFQQVTTLLVGSGVPPFSFGGADGWTLTDLFENIYLRQAGPAKYDQLASHQIKWTDPTVKNALKTMAFFFTNPAYIAGGTSGALQTDFATSVTQAFASPPKAAMVLEGDFVAGVITGSTKAKPITDFNVFSFPSIGNSPPAVVGGGDAVVLMKDTPAGRAMIRYLATPQAAEIWAKRGGFSSPNQKVRPSAYSDPLTRRTAVALAQAKTFRFDLSDLQPAAFGGTVGQGLFKLFQDFVRSPEKVDDIASQMEAAAAKAYKK
jgi:ABC-type glycerol-3-phosphate transport system substrate-binding protein